VENISKTGEYLHNDHPKTCDADDFWGQVSRTVKGVPVSQIYIDMIVAAIANALKFSSTDNLLDIGCGNGALSKLFFDKISKFHGVDFSEYLVSIAKKNFEKIPMQTFTVTDAVDYVENKLGGEGYTKALCYGAFAYFSVEKAQRLLAGVFDNFPNVDLFFIGNLPDKDKVDLFAAEKSYVVKIDDYNTPIGIWRTQDEFREMANQTGWDVDFTEMPNEFYSSGYRYDALLKRKMNRIN
jgi:cyclopropane fatty-acyl-phospholipid synthase-like methyltransferase